MSDNAAMGSPSRNMKTRVNEELMALRQKGLAKNQRGKFADASGFLTPEKAYEYITKTRTKKKSQPPAPPTNITTTSDLNDWYSRQKRLELEEKKKREEAERYLRGYRTKLVKIKSSKVVGAAGDKDTIDPHSIVDVTDDGIDNVRLEIDKLEKEVMHMDLSGIIASDASAAESGATDAEIESVVNTETEATVEEEVVEENKEGGDEVGAVAEPEVADDEVKKADEQEPTIMSVSGEPVEPDMEPTAAATEEVEEDIPRKAAMEETEKGEEAAMEEPAKGEEAAIDEEPAQDEVKEEPAEVEETAAEEPTEEVDDTEVEEAEAEKTDEEPTEEEVKEEITNVDTVTNDVTPEEEEETDVAQESTADKHIKMEVTKADPIPLSVVVVKDEKNDAVHEPVIEVESVDGEGGKTILHFDDVDKSTKAPSEDESWRDLISNEPGAVFPPEQNRYHLYVSHACPWAHRTVIVLGLKGLQKAIGVTYVHPTWQFTKPGTDEHRGWVFGSKDGKPFSNTSGVGCFPSSWGDEDVINGAKSIRDIYEKANDTTGQYILPVLWDKKMKTIVSNESSEIIRMLNFEFNEFAENATLDLYPEHMASDIDDTNAWIYPNFNNGVYRCGLASTQEAYDTAIDQLTQSFDKIDSILQKQRFIAGDSLTEADVRLFVTLVRFDEVYDIYFKTNTRNVANAPAVLNYVREIYQMAGVKETCRMDMIKAHYYTSHVELNKYSIIPRGDNFIGLIEQPHNRGFHFEIQK